MSASELHAHAAFAAANAAGTGSWKDSECQAGAVTAGGIHIDTVSLWMAARSWQDVGVHRDWSAQRLRPRSAGRKKAPRPQTQTPRGSVKCAAWPLLSSLYLDLELPDDGLTLRSVLSAQWSDRPRSVEGQLI